MDDVSELSLGLLWRSGKKLAIKSVVAMRGESWLPVWHASILMYHGVLPHGAVSTDWSQVSAEDFETQMRFIKRYYRPVPLDEIVRCLLDGKALPPRAVAITFDDGLRNNHEVAVPILRRLGIPATFFAVSGFIGSDRLLWIDRLALFDRVLSKDEPERWREVLGGLRREMGIDACGTPGRLEELMKQTPYALKERAMEWLAGRLGEWDGRPVAQAYLPMSVEQLCNLDADPLFTIGAHTVSHEIVSQCEPGEARRQIFQGKADLEAMLDHPVAHFAFPNGKHGNINEAGRRLVAEAGFLSASTSSSLNVTRRNNPLDLSRLGIGNESFNLDILRLGLLGMYPAMHNLTGRIRRSTRQPGV